MSKKTKAFILVLLLCCAVCLVYGFIKGKDSARWKADWEAAQTELEQKGFEILELKKKLPGLEDLPDGVQPGGVLEGETEATDTAAVQDPITIVKWKTPACPLPDATPLERAEHLLDTCVQQLEDARDQLQSCPRKPWVYRAALTPETLAARCRAEWVHAPSGDVNGRLFGQGLLELSDGQVEGTWSRVQEFAVKAVAPSEKKPKRRLAFMLGLHLERWSSTVSHDQQAWSWDETQVTPELAMAWWGPRRDGAGHRRRGWYASVNGDSLDSLSGSVGLSLTKP